MAGQARTLASPTVHRAAYEHLTRRGALDLFAALSTGSDGKQIRRRAESHPMPVEGREDSGDDDDAGDEAGGGAWAVHRDPAERAKRKAGKAARTPAPPRTSWRAAAAAEAEAERREQMMYSDDSEDDGEWSDLYYQAKEGSRAKAVGV